VKTRFVDTLARFESVNLVGTAMLVGLATGAFVILFKILYEWMNGLFFNESVRWYWILALPILAGLLVGVIRQYLLPPEELHGTSAIISSVALAGGKLPYTWMPIKTLAALLSIGGGASVGPEDPSVVIGSNIGSFFSSIFHLNEERMRTMVSAGAASAIAAAFNSPIAGVFFAYEIIVGELSGTHAGLILISAVTSSAFTQFWLGESPAFFVPKYSLESYLELPLYLLLGMVAGAISALYIKLLYGSHDVFHRLSWHPVLKTAFAGILVGIVGVTLPKGLGLRAMSVGYETISEALNPALATELTIGVMLLLMTLKLLLTSISLGGGFMGGVFAPSLFIGAMLGGAFGGIADLLFPSLGITPSAFALVGMAALLVGAVHAPLTSILLLFEMTNDYRIILPVMLATAGSMLVSQWLQPESVYHQALTRKGINLERGRDVEVLSNVTVGEAMKTDYPVLSEDMSLEEAADYLVETRHHGLAVTNAQNDLIGVLTVQDIDRSKGARVKDAMTVKTEIAFDDENLSSALKRMSKRDIGRLPVVNRAAPRKLIGMLRREDVITAYDLALTRRAIHKHKHSTQRLRAFQDSSMDVLEIVVESGSLASGKKLMEMIFPTDCVIASIRRQGQVFIPHGATEIKPGDVLVVVIDRQHTEQVRALCQVSDN